MTPESLTKTLVAQHSVTKACIEGLVNWCRLHSFVRSEEMADSVRRHLREFVAAVINFTLLDRGTDVRAIAVGTDGWRLRLMTDNRERLYGMYGFDGFIQTYARALAETPEVGEELRVPHGHLARTVSQMTRLAAAGYDPRWVVDAMPHEVLDVTR